MSTVNLPANSGIGRRHEAIIMCILCCFTSNLSNHLFSELGLLCLKFNELFKFQLLVKWVCLHCTLVVSYVFWNFYNHYLSLKVVFLFQSFSGSHCNHKRRSSHHWREWQAMYCSWTENEILWRHFLRNHLRPMRRFYGAYLLSKTANSIFKNSHRSFFFKDDFENRFLKIYSITTTKNVVKIL